MHQIASWHGLHCSLITYSIAHTFIAPLILSHKTHLYTVLRYHSYPAVLVIPQSISDDTLLRVAKNHRQGRFPVAIWRHTKNKATLLRAGGIERSSMASLIRSGIGSTTSGGQSIPSSSLEQEKLFGAVGRCWVHGHWSSFEGSICELAMPWLRSAQRLFQGSICELAMSWLRSAQRLFQGSICELVMPWLRSAQRLFQGSICELVMPCSIKLMRFLVLVTATPLSKNKAVARANSLHHGVILNPLVTSNLTEDVDAGQLVDHTIKRKGWEPAALYVLGDKHHLRVRAVTPY